LLVCNMPVFDIIDLGLCDYKDVLEKQHAMVEKRIAGEAGETFIFVEHPPTITLGARASANKLLLDAEAITAKGIELVSIRRGGGTTAHNPGQLVLYPIVNIKHLQLGVAEFIRGLEKVGIELLSRFGLNCQRRNGFPGLWIGEKKIASIGVKIKKWTTYHGMAININNDLDIFDYIVPCGLDNVEMTSLKTQLGKSVDMQNVKDELKNILEEHFINHPKTSKKRPCRH